MMPKGGIPKSPIDRFEKLMMPEPMSGCWIWLGYTMPNGYGMFSVVTSRKSAERGHILAHRAAWKLMCGPLSDEDCVLHRCDNRSCVNPDHLFLGSQKDNIHDMIAKGRGIRGEMSGTARLSVGDIVAIRASKDRNMHLAEKYGISRTHVSAIQRRRRWGHV